MPPSNTARDAVGTTAEPNQTEPPTKHPPTGRTAEGPTVASQLEADRRRYRPGGSGWNLNGSPDSVYGMGCGFNVATFGVLTLGNRFEDWRIQVENVDVRLKF